MLLANYISFVISASIIGFFKIGKFKPDLIFVYEPSPISVGIPAIFLSKVMKAPIVFWVLDLWPDTLRAVGIIKSKILLRLTSYFVKFIYNNSEVILAHSRKFLPNIKKHTKTKVTYFPSWSEDNFNCNKILIPGLPEKKLFRVIFAGNIGEAQDMPSILLAAQLLSKKIPIRFIIVGSGRKYKWLKKEISNLGLNKFFILLGQRPSHEVPGLIMNADVLLVTLGKDPIFKFTVPGKIQTYLKSSKPIVGMIDGEGADIINDSKSGLSCSAGDVKGLVNIINSIYILNEKERKRLGENGLKFYNKNFDKKFLLNKLVNIFTNIKSN